MRPSAEAHAAHLLRPVPTYSSWIAVFEGSAGGCQKLSSWLKINSPQQPYEEGGPIPSEARLRHRKAVKTGEFTKGDS